MLFKVMFSVVVVIFKFVFAHDNAQSCFDSKGRLGNCKNLANCPHLLEEFYVQAQRFPDGVDFQSFVSQSICAFDGFNFLICCTIRPTGGNPVPVQNSPVNPWYGSPSSTLFHFAALGNPINPETTTTLATFRPPVIRPSRTPPPILRPTPTTPQPTNIVVTTTTAPTLPPLIINPVPGGVFLTSQPLTSVSGECGITNGPTNRVVGGIETKKGAYPWVAALGYYEQHDPTVLKFFCGGSLVTTTYVLTSAHCINSALSLVRLGAHDLSKTEANAIDIRIKRKVIHDKFDLKTISNDIALIQLNSPVTFTEFIRPICLPDGNKFMEQDFVGSNPFVAGWGSVQYQGVTSNVLRDAQVPIVSTSSCMDNYAKVFKVVESTSSLICAGTYKADACQGDSGGPLMMPQMEGKIFRYYLIGLVSYGYECARAGFPGVYTGVAAYMDWIKMNMM